MVPTPLRRVQLSRSSQSSSGQLRAQVGSRAALASELASVGFQVGVALGSQELIHLFRRRPAAAERERLLRSVGDCGRRPSTPLGIS